MSLFLGIDTSNYTTSCALFDSETRKVRSLKKLLPVKSGEKGIRQSDAVFHHTKQLPQLIEKLFCGSPKIDYVSCSCAPRSIKDSYMPCFLVGESAAKMLSAACDIPCYTTSHQCGHILAALYSCDRLDLAVSGKRFIALHVSGGTTDLLLCKANEDKELDISQIGGSLDLKAGQAVDRTGVMLGLDFPCGQELEKLALKSSRSFKLRPVIKGSSCCLSGLENLCRDMLDKGEDHCDIARFCLEYIGISVREMTRNALDQYGQMPVVFAGGVMSDSLIKDILADSFDSYFASPEFSCDNAAGVAIFGALKEGKAL
ncbi:MAG: peptidase M22 [Ruminococcus sp.]|nr:peptidase M22 [Ruminococcus sp.]